MIQPQKIRIVLVEDEPLIAILLEDLLKELGHDVCATEATEDRAVAAIRRESPDIIIVDRRLRQGSGLNVVTTILKDGFIPHIFMSGDDLRDEMLDPTAVVLRKPFLDSDLIAAIEKALPASRSSR